MDLPGLSQWCSIMGFPATELAFACSKVVAKTQSTINFTRQFEVIFGKRRTFATIVCKSG